MAFSFTLIGFAWSGQKSTDEQFGQVVKLSFRHKLMLGLVKAVSSL